MHHILYKTTNLVNGMIYIGVHSTNNLNDGYLGSGKLLVRDIELFGRHNFKREILREFDTAQQAYRAERKIVNKNFIKRLDTYNASIGGYGGGWAWYGRKIHKRGKSAEYKAVRAIAKNLREKFKKKNGRHTNKGLKLESFMRQAYKIHSSKKSV